MVLPSTAVRTVYPVSNENKKIISIYFNYYDQMDREQLEIIFLKKVTKWKTDKIIKPSFGMSENVLKF